MFILGHRGAISEKVSQNSLRAFEEAVSLADGFETDACASRDGDVFLIHEAKYADAARGVEYAMAEHLDAASAARLGGRRIEELTNAEVRELRLSDGQSLPTLQQAIELVGAQTGKLLNIELKAYRVVDPVLKLVKTAQQKAIIGPEALLLSSFNHVALETVRLDAPQLKIGAIFVGPDQPTTKLFPWHAGDPGAYTALTAEALRASILQRLQPDCFVIPEEILTAGTVAMIGDIYPNARLAAWVFTEKGNFDLPDLIRRLKTLPQDKILAMVVDNPRAFVKAWRG